MQLNLLFRAFRYKNYRLFFAGQTVSLIGTWMQQIAISWLVYRMSRSPFLLGLIGFSSMVPTFIFAPFGGIMADRWNRHRIIIITQILAMFQAFLLAYLVLSDQIAIWHLVGLGIFLGCVNSVDIPVRQAFTVDIVEKPEDLGNAIALNSSMVNSARLLGPSMAGVMIGIVGEGICFLINGISYLAVIAALFNMEIAAKQNQKLPHPHITKGLKEGWSYVMNFFPIKSILFLLALICLLGTPYVVLMPVFAKEILFGGPHTLGFLMGSSGVGALCAAFFLASRKNVRGLTRWLVLSSVAFGLSLILFSQSHHLPLSLILMSLAGFSMMMQMASSNIILQTLVDEDKRGRVMSFYTMAFMGMTPFGSIMAGVLAERIGAPCTLLISGTGCIMAAVLFASRLGEFRKMVIPVYENKGISR
ncbi:MAG: MFS transporter [Candidatus Aureabacteria bacterium]|nr:MFS transporter [Candidatus Auribacterota bacterium]